MAGGLPPPPTRAANGDFAWTSWYNQLYSLLSTTGSVSWDLINKAGSSVADLANRNHGLLSSILGTGSYHVAQNEATRLTAFYQMNTKAGVPVAADIPASQWAIYKNTSSGAVQLWVNDGGTLKSVTLT